MRKRLPGAFALLSISLLAQSPAEIARIRKLTADSKLAEAETLARNVLSSLTGQSRTRTPEYAMALTALSGVEIRQGKPVTPVVERTRQALALATELGLPASEIALIWNTLGSAHFNATDYRASIADYEQSLKLDPTGIAALNGLGQSHASLQQLDKAIPLHRQAIQLAEKTLGPKDRVTGISYYLLGNDYRTAGKLTEAETNYSHALEIFTSTPDSATYAATTGQALGTVYREQGDAARALPLFQDCIRVTENALGREHKSLIPYLNNMGLAANTLGDYSLAASSFHRALEILDSQKLAGTSTDASLRANYGIVLRNSGRLEEAREQYALALPIQERILGKDHPLVAAVVYSLALVLGDLGDRKERVALLERSCAIDRTAFGPEHQKTIECESSRAISLANSGKLEEARSLATANLEIARRVHGNTRVAEQAIAALGSIERQSRNYTRARELLREALAILEKDTKGFALAGAYLNLAEVEQNLGDSAEALRLLNIAATGFQDSFGSRYRLQAELLESKAEALRSLGRVDEAFETALESADRQQERSRELYEGLAEREALLLAAQDNGAFDLAFDLLAARPSQAANAKLWDRLIRSRASVLDAMSERGRLANGTTDPALREVAQTVSSARQNLAQAVLATPGRGAKAYQEQIRGLRDRLETAERNLARASAAFRQNRVERSAGFTEVAHALPQGSGLIALFVSNGNLAAFVLRGGATQAVFVPLGSNASAARLVKTWRAAIDRETESFGRLSPESDAAYRAAGAALRRAVWDPAMRPLTGLKRIYLVNAGPLQFVNFSTLPVGKDSFLLETGPEIRAIATERDLLLQTAPLNTRGLLTVGNPAYTAPPSTRSPCRAGTFDPLPGSAVESKSIAANWRARRGSATELEGAAATKEAVQLAAPGKRAIHMATHGFFLPDRCAAEPGFDGNPLLRSGLVLAGKDGILTAEEAASLNLEGTELVVLSACETGAGVLQLGEGVLGFRRAFRIAGAETLVSSLWPVADTDTQFWMSAFYRSFSAGLSPQQAAQRASQTQLALKRKNGESTNPFYWGAFLAVGVK